MWGRSSMWVKRYPEGARQQLGATGAVVTIGAYDGVHVGHQALLAKTVEIAGELGCPAVVMSFEPTPKEFFMRERAPARITRFRERAIQFAELGMDGFLCPRFDAGLAAISVEDFINTFLLDALATRHLVIGDDFRFGKHAEGSSDDLIRAGKKSGFDVTHFGSVLSGGERASSTLIREALQSGDMATVNTMLGRPYALSGRVVHGQQLGRTLGFPTANIRLKRRVSPVQGVFAVRTSQIDGRRYDGVASIGTRPTVNGQGVLLEVFLFDFDGDLYGRYLDVELVGKLRDEEKFSSLDEMTVQMHRDVAAAKAVLARPDSVAS
ncbi:MAG: bifunctional riboflavin kinase/FAD synthetase [Woeseiaceae bacterium]